jgi:hypothetical protein
MAEEQIKPCTMSPPTVEPNSQKWLFDFVRKCEKTIQPTIRRTRTINDTIFQSTDDIERQESATNLVCSTPLFVEKPRKIHNYVRLDVDQNKRTFSKLLLPNKHFIPFQIPPPEKRRTDRTLFTTTSDNHCFGKKKGFEYANDGVEKDCLYISIERFRRDYLSCAIALLQCEQSAALNALFATNTPKELARWHTYKADLDNRRLIRKRSIQNFLLNLESNMIEYSRARLHLETGFCFEFVAPFTPTQTTTPPQPRIQKDDSMYDLNKRNPSLSFGALVMNQSRLDKAYKGRIYNATDTQYSFGDVMLKPANLCTPVSPPSDPEKEFLTPLSRFTNMVYLIPEKKARNFAIVTRCIQPDGTGERLTPSEFLRRLKTVNQSAREKVREMQKELFELYSLLGMNGNSLLLEKRKANDEDIQTTKEEEDLDERKKTDDILSFIVSISGRNMEAEKRAKAVSARIQRRFVITKQILVFPTDIRDGKAVILYNTFDTFVMDYLIKCIRDKLEDPVTGLKE